MEFELRLAVGREALFRFHSNPDNLRLLLEGWPATEVLASDGHIRVGARVHLRERLGPLRLRMTFEQFVHEPPLRFGERMVAGPFRRFEHVHEFEVRGGDPGATFVRDRIVMELPWWLGGGLATRLVAGPRVRRFFEHRRRAYARLAAEGRFAG